MADFLHHLIFGIYPYIALAVLAVGSVIRYDREPYSWRAGSSQLLRRKQLMIGSVLFHLGVLVIFLGHVGGLLTPIAIWDALGVPHGARRPGGAARCGTGAQLTPPTRSPNYLPLAKLPRCQPGGETVREWEGRAWVRSVWSRGCRLGGIDAFRWSFGWSSCARGMGALSGVRRRGYCGSTDWIGTPSMRGCGRGITASWSSLSSGWRAARMWVRCVPSWLDCGPRMKRCGARPLRPKRQPRSWEKRSSSWRGSRRARNRIRRSRRR